MTSKIKGNVVKIWNFADRDSAAQLHLVWPSVYPQARYTWDKLQQLCCVFTKRVYSWLISLYSQEHAFFVPRINRVLSVAQFICKNHSKNNYTIKSMLFPGWSVVLIFRFDPKLQFQPDAPVATGCSIWRTRDWLSQNDRTALNHTNWLRKVEHSAAGCIENLTYIN